MLKIGILDDELFYRQKHYDIVMQTISGIDIGAEVICFKDINELLENCVFDIIFLDIEIGDDCGINIAKHLETLNHKVIIVYVTAYDKYMIDSFGLNVYKYILKECAETQIPVVLKSIINKLIGDRLINLKTENGICTYQSNDIVIIYIDRRKIYLVTQLEVIQIYYTTMKKVKKLLTDDFIFANSSTIINLKNVDGFMNNTIKMKSKDNLEIPVSRGNVKKVQELYKQFLCRKVKESVR